MSAADQAPGSGQGTAVIDDDLLAAERRVMADLRRARRRRRTASFDPFEALYRAYITGVLGAVAVWLLSGVIGDTRVGAAEASRVAAHGATWMGLAFALVFAVGLRSGGRGGPLALEAADVRHVLLSPVDRGLALRGPAIRQLRFAAAVATGVGAVGGLLAYRRLPGEVLEWVACGGFAAACATVGSLGLALVASGRRFGPRVGSLLALAVLAWSALDLATGTVTSPAGFLAEVALWPLRFRPLGLIGPVAAVAAVLAGLQVVGGSSIEAAERRAALVGQIRFAATLRDLRTVMVLRRQLAQELPRQRPWVRLPRTVDIASLAVGGAAGGPAARAGNGAGTPARHRRRLFPVWRRGWHGVLRFPATRLARIAVLGAAAGAAMVGAWRGTTALVIVAGLALYVAGLDAVEPLSQELDHPDRCDSYEVEQGVLLVRALGPPFTMMLAVALIGYGVAVAISGGSAVAVGVGAVLVVPAALAATAGAALSATQGPPPLFSSTDSLMPPELAGIKSILRMLLPPLIAICGLLPALAGRHPAAGVPPASPVASLVVPVVLLVGLAGMYIRYRANLSKWWREAMEEAKTGGAARARGPGGGMLGR